MKGGDVRRMKCANTVTLVNFAIDRGKSVELGWKGENGSPFLEGVKGKEAIEVGTSPQRGD